MAITMAELIDGPRTISRGDYLSTTDEEGIPT
jgi:hypothetical protein